MQKFISNRLRIKFKYIMYGLSAICFLLSISIGQFDESFNYRWLVFWLHIVSVLSIVTLYIKESVYNKKLGEVSERDILAFGFVLIVIEAVSLLFLTDYPFVSVGDEVRDGGLNTMQIADGTLQNIFAYGRYDAHGLIIPTITSFFYQLFGGSVLTYRFPSALLACIEVAAIFMLMRMQLNRTAAFFSALVLATLPLHIFFARTQVVVAFNSFWSSIILLSLYLLLKKKRAVDYAFFGTIIGFVFGFHAAIRVVAILVLLCVIGISLYEIVSKFIKKHQIRNSLLKLFLLVLFCFVGFGPRLLFSNTTNFLHTSRFVLQQDAETKTMPTMQEVQTIKDNYLKSLMVWFYEPTQYMYPDHKPIFPPLLAAFFLLGIGHSLFVVKNPFLYVLTFLIITVPLLSSAITDSINADHRLSPLMPIGIVFVGVGVYYVFSLVKYKYARYTLGILLYIYLLFQPSGFFINQPANKNYDIKDYLSMHIIKFIKSKQNIQFQNVAYSNTTVLNNNMCIFVSLMNYQNLSLAHYQEQYQYFLPNVIVQTKSDAGINDNEAYLFNGSCPTDYKTTIKQHTISCNSMKHDFFCPLNFTGNIVIHY